MMNMERQKAWEETCERWLKVVFPALAEHALHLGRGDRGVLMVPVDTSDMEHQLACGAGRMDPAWHPAEEFLAMVQHLGGVGPDALSRWRVALELMDPQNEVALFLMSTPDADTGEWFSRFIVAGGGTMTVH